MPKKFTFDDELNTNNSKNQTNKPKRKFKVKKWQIAVIAALIVMIFGAIFLMVFSSNDGKPIYGDRCKSLISIDQKKFTNVISQVKASGTVTDMVIEVNCRTINIKMTFKDGTSAAEATQLATNALHVLDDSQGYEKSSSTVWSKLLSTSDNTNQYHVNFILRSNGTSFPIFGTKHPANDQITFKTTDAADETTKNSVISQGE